MNLASISLNYGVFVIKYLVPLTLASSLLVIAQSCGVKKIDASTRSLTDSADPYLFMEEVEGKDALDFVNVQSGKSKNTLESDVSFLKLKDEMAEVLGSSSMFPRVSFLGDHLVNFYKDAKSPRGFWRRAPASEFVSTKGDPAWETLLDLDALATAEGQSWVWKSAACLSPARRFCLLSLSPGGTDASVVREFDTLNKSFVTNNAFELPVGKHSFAQLDQDTVLLGPDFGGDTVTDSGYSKNVVLWKRGTDPRTANVLFTGEKTDVGVFPMVLRHNEKTLPLISVSKERYSRRVFSFNLDNTLQEILIPDDSSIQGLFEDTLLVSLASDWTVHGKTYLSGSLITFDFEHQIPKDILFSPSKNTSIASVLVTGNAVVLNTLQDVVSKISTLKKSESGWSTTESSLPGLGSVSLQTLNENTNQVFMSFESFTTPKSLLSIDTDDVIASPEKVVQGPSYFNASDLETVQEWAVSKDGTRVPYFITRKKGLILDGANPTLLYGYGGFKISMGPAYSGTIGKGWMERGGVYVVANIRGGGEYGPSWHQAALKENRQRAYDDFIAVAEALVAKKVTKPRHLGIYGGSNGGLLVGAVMTQRPELFNAVLCTAPLLDMLRYHKLLAGASWMGEYGNPDEPGPAADAIRKYSPYQNLQKGVKYPLMMITTSTKDDRVHPAHARKMAARLLEYGNEVLFMENTEGGHAGGADVTQAILEKTYQYAYLWRQLRNTEK